MLNPLAVSVAGDCNDNDSDKPRCDRAAATVLITTVTPISTGLTSRYYVDRMAMDLVISLVENACQQPTPVPNGSDCDDTGSLLILRWMRSAMTLM